MSEVPVRVLNQEAASVLARVERGEEIEVTEPIEKDMCRIVAGVRC